MFVCRHLYARRWLLFHQVKILKIRRVVNKSFSINSPKRSFSKPHVDSEIISSLTSRMNDVSPGIRQDAKGRIMYSGKRFDSLEPGRAESLLAQCGLQILQPEILDAFGVEISSDENYLFFPLYGAEGNLVSLQYINLRWERAKLSENVVPSTSELKLFGWLLARHSENKVVVTTNPIDAVAVNQATSTPAIAIPLKIDLIPIEILDVLQRFQKIIFWLDEAHHNWKTHKLLIEKLGKKAFFIRPQKYTTPFTSLQKGCDLKYILSEAYAMKHDSVETFTAFEEDVCDDFRNYEKSTGLKWKRFHVLNGLLKGLRTGELTIFSGQTGTGKTTFMSEYSLDLCLQGLPTLWGSFEVTNTRLIKTMFTQFSLCSLRNNQDQIAHFASEFKKMPMFFINFDGDHTLKHVINAMTHSVIVHSVQHVVIDNLQFMMNCEEFGSSIDHLRRQDQIFGAFRKFATQFNCHVTLVMHPRKEPEFTELNNTSISGSAKAIQEADNIMLLQTTKLRQYLQVTKNRFDGEKGCVQLEFDKSNLTFSIKKIFNNFKATS